MSLSRLAFVSGLLGIFLTMAAAQERPQQKIIRKITIQGLKRLSAPSVLAKLKLRIGQPYDPRAVSEETGNLFKTGDFSRVEDPKVQDFEDGVELVFVVAEKPRITTVKFQVADTPSGKPSISQKDLRDEIATKTDGRLTSYSLQADAEKIRRMYLDKGYCFAQVKTVTREAPGGTEITFVIEEGSRVRIRQIEFTGNLAIDSGDLLGVMETRPKDVLFFGLIHSGFYNEATLSRDVAQVTAYYRSKGFFEARVAVEDISFDAALERMRVLIRIDEGPRYSFRGYSFEGNRVFATPTLAALTRALPGQPYDEERTREDLNEILKYYRDRAYIEAKVDPQREFSLEGTDVRIRFKIEEGSEISIEYVRIKKNGKTLDRVVRRELEFYPGEKVNYSRIEKSKSNIARLQIFKDVKVSFEKGTQKDRNDVVVEVEEESTGRLILGFGLTSGLGIVGNISLQKRNFDITDFPDSIYDLPDAFTGAGQTLNIVVMPGTERSMYRVTFVEPYLFDTRNSLSLSGAISSLIRDDYNENRLSFTPRIGHAFDFDRDLVLSIGARLEQIDISNIALNSAPDVAAAQGYTSIIALNAGMSFDKVLQDRWEGPFDGYRETVNFEYGGQPLGGQLDFYKLDGSLELFFPIYVHEESQLHHVIGLFSKAGIIEPHHDQADIPIFERYFLGGPNTVRGFEYRGLGPHFGSDALGGAAAWYGNVEYVFPIFQKYLRGVIWLDYGNLAPEAGDFDLSKTRLAAGGGMRINFPFLGGQPLPIGLYLGYPIHQEEEDRSRVFLFTIGMPF